MFLVVTPLGAVAPWHTVWDKLLTPPLPEVLVALRRGVQHAYEIFNVGTQKTALNISLNVFPNPTADNLTLHIGDYQKEKLLYQIFDMQGEKIHNGPIVARHTQISMIQLPPGTYFLNVVDQKIKKFIHSKSLKSKKYE
ncbi:MAG: T9SS type A sorting domain-containing protein [Saprospiraceae bacterium]|nr:T9SS type A sorting domain-containing protein [Candidatus Vicinibacter affinis]